MNILQEQNAGKWINLAVMMPKKNHLISIDFENFNEDMSFSLEQVEAHPSFSNYTIVGLNTGVQHKLSDSPYNQRREACELLLKLLCENFDTSIPALGSLAKKEYTKKVFLKVKMICLRTLLKRQLDNMGLEFLDDRTAAFGAHAIWENIRVEQAIQALKDGDIETLSKVMNESHLSLRDDYKVSCHELDLIRDFATTKQLSLLVRKPLKLQLLSVLE